MRASSRGGAIAPTEEGLVGASLEVAKGLAKIGSRKVAGTTEGASATSSIGSPSSSSLPHPRNRALTLDNDPGSKLRA